MQRKNFGRVSGVIVDTCGMHGTFFDAGELQDVLAFVRSGGLQAGAAQRHIDAIAEQRHRSDMAAANRSVGDGDGTAMALPFGSNNLWTGLASLIAGKLLNFDR